MIQKYTTGGGGWLDQVGLKLTQSPAKAGLEVGLSLAILWKRSFLIKGSEKGEIIRFSVWIIQFPVFKISTGALYMPLEGLSRGNF